MTLETRFSNFVNNQLSGRLCVYVVDIDGYTTRFTKCFIVFIFIVNNEISLYFAF